MAPDKAIIISTHILEEVPAVCSRAIIIARGRLLFDGTPRELVETAPGGQPGDRQLDAAFRQLTDAYAIVCAEILADDRRRGGGRGRRDGGGGAQPSTAEIMREITDDILEMVEMDVEGEEAGPRGWLPPAG